MKVFGEDLREYLIVVFTHKDDLEDENITVDEYVQSLNTSSSLSLRKLIDGSKNRYIAIGYKGEEEDRTSEVKQLLSMIEKNVGKNGKKYYSNEVFRSIQFDLKDFMEEIIREQKANRLKFGETIWIGSVIKKTREKIGFEYNNVINSLFFKIASTILASFGRTATKAAEIASMLLGFL